MSHCWRQVRNMHWPHWSKGRQPLDVMLYLLRELSKLSQGLCHDDCTIDIALFSVYYYCYIRGVWTPIWYDDVPANQILQTCCKAQDGVRPSPDWRRARGRPLTTWIHQIRRDTGISVTDALELAGTDRFGGKSQPRDATADRFVP